MKILYIITRSDVIGGASIHLLDLASGIQALGHEVLILVGGNGIFAEQAKKRNLRVNSLNHLVREISPFKDVLAIKEIGKIICAFKPDLLHLHSSKAGVVGRIVARLHSVPSIFTAHGWAFTEGVSPLKRRLYVLIEYLLAPLSSKIITVSNYDRDIALKHGVGNSDLLINIPNGVHDTFPISIEDNGDDLIRFVMVARFDEPKDQLLLLRALAPLRRYSWLIEFVGDGPLLNQCKTLAVQLQLVEKVKFSGFCEDVHRRIENSDVFILASKWEGLPLTIIEAMRGGIPVIASNVGGIPELVVDGVTGYLAEAGSEISMRKFLQIALQDTNKLKLMGIAGRKRYECLFSFETMRDRTVEIYKSVLSKTRI